MHNISTQNLLALPEIDHVKRISKSIAMLDAIISPEWEYRYYSYDSKWSNGEEMASMRNGSGDEYFILLDNNGCFIKGFDHESFMSSWNKNCPVDWKKLLKTVPDVFSSGKNEPAFSMDSISFCIWRSIKEDAWNQPVKNFPDINDPDGSEHLLSIFNGKPQSYQIFADEYYEVSLPIESITQIYNHEVIDQKLISTLNSEIELKDLLDDIEQIGYPYRNR